MLPLVDAAEAKAFDVNDKADIDRLVLKTFGSFDAANKLIRDRVRHGYFSAVASAYQPAPDQAQISAFTDKEAAVEWATEALEQFEQRGKRPLFENACLASSWATMKPTDGNARNYRAGPRLWSGCNCRSQSTPQRERQKAPRNQKRERHGFWGFCGVFGSHFAVLVFDFLSFLGPVWCTIPAGVHVA